MRHPRHRRRNAIRASIGALVAACATFGLGQTNAAVQQATPDSTIRQSLQALGKFSPDPCGVPDEAHRDSNDLESALFQTVMEKVGQALNSNSTAAESPAERARESLEVVRKWSAEVNTAWPEENRFQFKILDLTPALVLKVAIRSHAHYYVFGIPQEDDSGKPNHTWREVGSDDQDEQTLWLSLEVYPLHRGSDHDPRFLAKFVPSGCAGSLGISYDAREWSPAGSGSFDQIIKLTGALGLDKVAGFPQIGVLKTDGPLIKLPYCWFSPIDTWDNPSMCAVDTYDLSKDAVKFQTRTYNRPDLLPIAKALEYSEQRDYPAVLAYCSSAAVARRLVREIPPFVMPDDLKVTRITPSTESVSFGAAPAYRFVVAKSKGRWRVTKFSPE